MKKMSFFSISSLLLATVLFTSATQKQEVSHTKQTSTILPGLCTDTFIAHDQNDDGYLDRDEFQPLAEAIERTLEDLDQDQDGLISLPEWYAYCV